MICIFLSLIYEHFTTYTFVFFKQFIVLGESKNELVFINEQLNIITFFLLHIFSLCLFVSVPFHPMLGEETFSASSDGPSLWPYSGGVSANQYCWPVLLQPWGSSWASLLQSRYHLPQLATQLHAIRKTRGPWHSLQVSGEQVSRLTYENQIIISILVICTCSEHAYHHIYLKISLPFWREGKILFT